MLQKGCLYQIGVEFHQKVIGAIVNLPTPKQRTHRGSKAFSRFFVAFFITSLVFMLQKVYLDQIGVEFHQKVIDAIVNLPTPKRRTLRGSMGIF